MSSKNVKTSLCEKNCQIFDLIGCEDVFNRTTINSRVTILRPILRTVLSNSEWVSERYSELSFHSETFRLLTLVGTILRPILSTILGPLSVKRAISESEWSSEMAPTILSTVLRAISESEMALRNGPLHF